MKINPVSTSIFSIKNDNQKSLKATKPLKTFESFDTFSLSFGKKQKSIDDKQGYDFKKEFGEVKKALKNRSDFSLKEKRNIKKTIKGNYFFEEAIFNIEISLKKETQEEFNSRMKEYTDFAKEIIQNEKLSGSDINEILQIASDKEKMDIEKLLITNEEFPPERIIPFILSASELNCNWGKIKQMLENGESLEEKLIQDTITFRLNGDFFHPAHFDS